MDNSYLLLKSIHIFGVILLMGNIIVTAWWKFNADKTKDPRVIKFAQRQVTLTDFVFTAPGAFLAVVAGDSMSYVFMSNTWDIEWLTWGRCLFIASGVIWITILIPTQIKQARMVRNFSDAKSIPEEYWKLSKRWNVFGAIAVTLPLINIYWISINRVSWNRNRGYILCWIIATRQSQPPLSTQVIFYNLRFL